MQENELIVSFGVVCLFGSKVVNASQKIPAIMQKSIGHYFTTPPKASFSSENPSSSKADSRLNTSDPKKRKAETLTLSEERRQVSASPAADSEELEYDLPWFTLPAHIRDANRLRPDHADYNPSTLHIPPTEKFTPAMQQYWAIKALHNDKVVLFKLGKFYELMYQDAIFCQKVLDLNWMGGHRKTRVGFPERALERYAAIIVNCGRAVVVVEQTETPQQLAELNKNVPGKKPKAVGRAVTEVFTKSTFIDKSNSLGLETRWLLCLIEVDRLFGIAVADVATSTIILGEVTESELRTVVTQCRPTEVVFCPSMLSGHVLQMLKAQPNPPVFTTLLRADSWRSIKIHEFFPTGFPKSLRELKQLSTMALAGCCSFLESVLLAEQLIPYANYIMYDSSKLSKAYMTVDAKALEQLEILDASHGATRTKDGSLLEYIDHTSTALGKRLLRRWICAPLTQASAINNRLDAVQELINRFEVVRQFDSEMKGLPDIERLLSRVSTYSVQSNSSAVYFEDVSSARLKEFQELLKHLVSLQGILERLERHELKAEKLRFLTTAQLDGGGVPELRTLCAGFEGRIVWKDGKPQPSPGSCQEYEDLRKPVDVILKALDVYLQEQRARFSNHPEINYAHAKVRFEIEVPKHLVDGSLKPLDYDLTSTRQSFERFHTSVIVALVDKLELAEHNLAIGLRPFICSLLKEFYGQAAVWQQAIQIVAELDCLCSLAKVAKLSVSQMTRPEFVSDDSRLLYSEGLVHPVLAKRMPGFIANNVSFDSDNYCKVLTGPNMGGKSTILRQLCQAVILAQIGSFVPAAVFRLSPVDRIFTRLGASDRMYEGKSTFYVEMEEAAAVLRDATENSLVIMDELGRGTSTYDGMAIAYATLKRVVGEIKPRALFTTHYHILVEELARLEGVEAWHMSAHVYGTDVTFLYKLQLGVCPSYAMNVAKMVGLSEALIVMAQVKAKELDREMKMKQLVKLWKAAKANGKSMEDFKEVIGKHQLN